MSTTYQVICKDCEARPSAKLYRKDDHELFLDYGVRNGDDYIRALLKHRPALEAMSEALLAIDTAGVWLRVQTDLLGAVFDPQWFARHRGHRLVLRGDDQEEEIG